MALGFLVSGLWLRLDSRRLAFQTKASAAYQQAQLTLVTFNAGDALHALFTERVDQDTIAIAVDPVTADGAIEPDDLVYVVNRIPPGDQPFRLQTVMSAATSPDGLVLRTFLPPSPCPTTGYGFDDPAGVRGCRQGIAYQVWTMPPPGRGPLLLPDPALRSLALTRQATFTVVPRPRVRGAAGVDLQVPAGATGTSTNHPLDSWQATERSVLGEPLYPAQVPAGVDIALCVGLREDFYIAESDLANLHLQSPAIFNTLNLTSPTCTGPAELYDRQGELPSTALLLLSPHMADQRVNDASLGGVLGGGLTLLASAIFWLLSASRWASSPARVTQS